MEQTPNDTERYADALQILLKSDTLSDVQKTKQMLESMLGFKELLMMYACAIKEIRTKFEVLNTEFNVRYKRNPISHIETRLKSNTSIIMKMMRKSLPITRAAIEENINDVAGIRIICSYKDDIYRLAESLLRQDDITLLAKKDYIQNPKPNGYRSYHMIVSVPVFFANERRDVKVEVQIRTIAMDFWASLEHQMKYKQATPQESEIEARLKVCADAISSIDAEMLALRKQIDAGKDIQTEEDLLFERLRHLSEPIV